MGASLPVGHSLVLRAQMYTHQKFGDQIFV